MNRIRRLLAHFALLLLAACGSLPPANLQAPEVGVSDVPLTNIRLDLTVFDIALANGTVVERQVTLPSRGRQQVPVEFTVPTSRLLDVLERFCAGNWDNFSYRLAGHANWGNTPFGVPFERTGNLDILKRLSIIFGAT